MKAKILIIDDDTSLRRVLEYNLQEEGYEVQAASSGEEGLYLFGQAQPDLVITDMKNVRHGWADGPQIDEGTFT